MGDCCVPSPVVGLYVRLVGGDDVDGELAVEEVVVVGDEENSDWEDNLSTSSRKRAASRRVFSLFVAMADMANVAALLYHPNVFLCALGLSCVSLNFKSLLFDTGAADEPTDDKAKSTCTFTYKETLKRILLNFCTK